MKRPRRGYSLVQTLVLMTAISTILSLSSVLIVRVQRLHHAAARVHDDERTAWRLSADLRRAIHTAADAAVETNDDGAALTLRDAVGVESRFRFDVDGVERSGDGAAEAYPLHARPVWDVSYDEAARLVLVSTERADEATIARHGTVTLRVVARLLAAPAEEGGS